MQTIFQRMEKDNKKLFGNLKKGITERKKKSSNCLRMNKAQMKTLERLSSRGVLCKKKKIFGYDS